MQGVERRLIAGIGMNGGHEAGLDAHGVVQHLCDRREAIGGAGAVRDHLVIPGQLIVVDAVDNGCIGIVGRRRDQHALGAGGQMQSGLVLCGENAGAFQRDVDAEFFPRQLGRIALGRNLDLAVAEADRIPLDGHGAREAPMHGIEAQQMRIGFDRSEVVDADDFDIRAAGLRDSPQHIAADAAKPVDCDPDCHSISPQKLGNRVFFGQPRRFFCAFLGDFIAWMFDEMHHNPERSHSATSHLRALTQPQPPPRS